MLADDYAAQRKLGFYASDYAEHKRPIVGSQHFFRGQHIISDQVDRQELAIIWDNLATVLQAGVAGDIVEFGCYVGTTSLFIRRLLDASQQSGQRSYMVYDSFTGLPEKSSADASPAGQQFQAGELRVSKKELLLQFRKAHLRPPTIHAGWFSDLTDHDLPQHIAFAFLDGDFYQSIIDSLKLVWPRLSPGGVILVDDYGREALPGVERAIKDFFQDKTIQLQHQHSIAIIKP